MVTTNLGNLAVGDYASRIFVSINRSKTNPVTPYKLEIGIFRCKNGLTFVYVRAAQILLFEEPVVVSVNKKGNLKTD